MFLDRSGQGKGCCLLHFIPLSIYPIIFNSSIHHQPIHPSSAHPSIINSSIYPSNHLQPIHLSIISPIFHPIHSPTHPLFHLSTHSSSLQINEPSTNQSQHQNSQTTCEHPTIKPSPPPPPPPPPSSVYQLIWRRRFEQMEVLEGQNILVTISGKKNKLRVYYLSWLKTKIIKTDGVCRGI